MIYLIMQILLCLLIAFLLGLLVGWLLCKLCCKSKIETHYETDHDVDTAPKGFVSNYDADVDNNATINLDTNVDLDTDGYAIETLEGIGPQTGTLFRNYGVATVGDYLRKLYKPAQREEAAKELNILVKPLHDWASMSDLLRVEGIDHQYAELVYATGVNTVAELGRFDANKLLGDMERVNSAGKQLIAPTLPTLNEVESWISKAGNMSPVVSV